ncbi:Two-component response regulator-like PRR95-like protein [Drosera capensis]
MGEVMVWGEEMGVEILEKGLETAAAAEKKSKEGVGSGSIVRWERFLPRMVVRVLLVEADDSTRQIISALLRKCSYKVAAVPDGLKAWEVLKGRSSNIDLILTEVDLPSISGFALLTLIMEHETCKNIPVIMMSSQDSISMVYKCMLRGAADYLVKPIRINELKNLWQHVWRRQSQFGNGTLSHQEGTVAQEKAEATAENNAVSSHSSGSKACSWKQEDIVKKWSDARSSCTKADLEAESANMEEKPDFPHQNMAKTSFMCQAPPKEINVQSVAAKWQTSQEVVNCLNIPSLNTGAPENSSREAINLIEAFVNKTRDNFGATPAENGHHEYEPSQLDLSLRRFPGNNANEKVILNHSGASAFSRYIYKPMQPMRPTAVSVCNSEEGKISAGDNLSDKMNCSDSDAMDAEPSNLGGKLSMPTVRKEQAEVAFPYVQQQQSSFPGPPLLHGSLRLESLSPGYNPIAPPSSSPLRSSSLGSQQESSVPMNSFRQLNMHSDTSNSANHHNPYVQSPKMSINHTISGHVQAPVHAQVQPRTQAQSFECLDQRTQFCSSNDQSVASSLANSGASHLNKASNAAAAAPFCAPESGIEQASSAHAANSQRSSRREDALNKFRMKRKERCYEKKVRYESRKKLAEQRPRVKGQFVRQVPHDPPPSKSETSWGNSSGG